jgi:uncharacterized integral membrane protein
MRVLLQILIALVFVAGGVLFGAFNPQPVTIDFHFLQIQSGLGVSLLVALLAGSLLGGIVVAFGVALPLHGHLRKARREIAAASSATVKTNQA